MTLHPSTPMTYAFSSTPPHPFPPFPFPLQPHPSQLLRFPRSPLPLQTHRPPLHHNRHDLKERIRRRHGRQLGIGIVSRRHLDNISGYEVEAFETTDDGSEFARGPAAGFGGAGCGGICVGVRLDCGEKCKG